MSRPFPGPFMGGKLANMVNGFFKHRFEVSVRNPALQTSDIPQLLDGTGLKPQPNSLRNFEDHSTFEVVGTGRQARKLDDKLEPQRPNVFPLGWE